MVFYNAKSKNQHSNGDILGTYSNGIRNMSRRIVLEIVQRCGLDDFFLHVPTK
jgi:hypothetical protein